MDDERDAVEAFERDLFQLDTGHESDSNNDGSDKELEDLLYSASHHACDLRSQQSLHIEPTVTTTADAEPTEQDDTKDQKQDEDHKSHDDGETSNKKKKAPPKRYYDPVEDKLNSSLSNKICDTCKERGHVKRHCPNWKANIQCYNCNKSGHFSRECPTKEADKVAREANITCYRCTQIGHLARDCPNERAEDAGAEKYKTCYKCNEVGHIARDCTNEHTEDVDADRYKTCYKCNANGHVARNCVQENKGERSLMSGVEDSLSEEVIRYMQSYTSTDDSCRNCGGAGHTEDICWKKQLKFSCNNCGGVGHRPKDCPSHYVASKRSAEGLVCGCCGKSGHFARNCPDATDVAAATPNKSNPQSCTDSPIYKSKWSSETPLGAVDTSAVLGVVGTSSTLGSAGTLPASEEKPNYSRGVLSSKSLDKPVNDDFLPLNTKTRTECTNQSQSYNDFMTKCDEAVNLISSTEDENNTDNDNNNNNFNKNSKKKVSKEHIPQNSAVVSYSPLSDLGIDENKFSGETSKKKKKKKKKKNQNEVEPPKKENRDAKPPMKEDGEQKPQSDWLSRCESIIMGSNENKKPDTVSVYDLSTDDEVELPVCGTSKTEEATASTAAYVDQEKEGAAQTKNTTVTLDHETLNNLRNILWDSADDDASDDSADIPDVLSLPGVEMEEGGIGLADSTSTRGMGNEILMNLDSSSDTENHHELGDHEGDVIFADRMTYDDGYGHYNPTEFSTDHLVPYGVSYSPSSQKVDIQPVNLSEAAKWSGLEKRKRKAKPNNQPDKSKKQKMNIPGNKVKKKRGGALKSFKKNFSCGTSTNSPVKPNRNTPVKTRLKPEDRGFKFRKGVKKDVIVLD